MAINIFSGGSKNAGTPRRSSAADRAAETTAALPGPAAASDSGSTAVGSTGIGSKIGGLISKVADTASNLPGIPGLIGKGVSLFSKIMSKNDPEWWNTIKGDGLSVNAPLSAVSQGKASGYMSSESTNIEPKLNALKPAFLEFVVEGSHTAGTEENYNDTRVLKPNERMVTQYIMPQVRKVTNAVYLQSASAYARVLAGQATMYALWRNLKKYDFFLKNGKTFVPNLNVGLYPIFQVKNAAWLQSTITRLEEYLHSHVRLPHTLCEYLSWRFGRIHRTNTSAKAGFVFYNILPMVFDVEKKEGFLTVEGLIQNIQDELSSTEELQKATSDLYNAYQDHDQEVTIPDESQMTYDPKEFVLRTNLDLKVHQDVWKDVKESNIIMDSQVDNPTTFMASTVSTEANGSCLFPVDEALVHLHDPMAAENDTDPKGFYTAANGFIGKEPASSLQANYTTYLCNSTSIAREGGDVGDNGGWLIFDIAPFLYRDEFALSQRSAYSIVTACALAKAVDLYNVGIFVVYGITNGTSSSSYSASNLKTACGDKIAMFDLTQISIDSGNVPDLVIENEQILAFANLVYPGHKDRTTYKKIEQRVAKDVANFVEEIPVASVK